MYSWLIIVNIHSYEALILYPSKSAKSISGIVDETPPRIEGYRAGKL